MPRKRILLADDHSELLEDVQSLLNDDYDIVGTVPDGLALVGAACELKPDLIVSDICMPGLSGFDAASKIQELGLTTKFVFLSVQASPGYIRKAYSVGASGYVIKSHATEQLQLAVSRALDGESFFPSEGGLSN